MHVLTVSLRNCWHNNHFYSAGFRLWISEIRSPKTHKQIKEISFKETIGSSGESGYCFWTKQWESTTWTFIFNRNIIKIKIHRNVFTRSFDPNFITCPSVYHFINFNAWIYDVQCVDLFSYFVWKRNRVLVFWLDQIWSKSSRWRLWFLLSLILTDYKWL